MGNEVMKSGDNLPEWIMEDSGATGFETVDSDCVSLPYLKLAQSTTDQAKKGHAKYISGLEPGMYFNSNSGRIYGGQFICLGFVRQFVEYDSCGLKSKFVRTYTSNEYMRDVMPRTTKKEIDGKTYTVDAANGHSFADTRNFFVIAADAPEDGVLIYSHRSSGIGASKKWLSAMSAKRATTPDGRVVRLPIYSSVWAPRVELISDGNNSWHQYNAVDCVCPVPQAMREVVKVAFDEVQEYIQHGKRLASDESATVERVFGSED